MKHEFIVKGYAFRLRPVADADAQLIVALRTDCKLSAYLHRTSERVEDQIDWLSDYYRRPDDYYFAVENVRGVVEGFISLYDVEKSRSVGEWGRWILRKGSLAAVESALLIYRFAFESLGLREVFCRTVSANQSVVSFHDSCGVSRRLVMRGFFQIDGRAADAIEHRVSIEDWMKIQSRLNSIASSLARKVLSDRGEK